MSRELALFFCSIWMGAVLLLCYDLLRILRGVIPHGRAAVAVEDLCYWIIGAVYIFCRIYQENQGMLRSFLFAGILLGMLAYQKSVSPFFVSFFVKTLRIPVKYAAFGIKRLIFAVKRCRILLRGRKGKRPPKQGKKNKRL